MKKIEDFIVQITGWLLAALMFVMMVDIFAAVVVRYVLHTALNFSEELGRYTFCWIVFIGMARCVAADAHVALDLLPNALKGRPAKYLKTLIYILCLVFLWLSPTPVFRSASWECGRRAPRCGFP